MLPYAVIVLLSVVVATTTILRMRKSASVPTLFWITMLLSLANPIFVGWVVNYPEAEIETVELKKEKESVSLNVPESYSLMITAIPSSEKLDPSDEKSYKTDYALQIEGMNDNKIWTQTVTGAMERKSQDDERVKLKKIQGEKISSQSGEGRVLSLPTTHNHTRRLE